MAPLAEIAQLPVPADAFGQYAGRWIALRGGQVIADADTLTELDADPRVDSGDTRFRGPQPLTRARTRLDPKTPDFSELCVIDDADHCHV